jgi:G:T-mismatch repair DNA endonuclease (very short patch repair protein)
MRSMRSQHTAPERHLGAILDTPEQAFRRQAGGLPGRPDFVSDGVGMGFAAQWIWPAGHPRTAISSAVGTRALAGAFCHRLKTYSFP